MGRVEPLRSCGRNDVRGIPGQVQAPMLHRVDEECPDREVDGVEDRSTWLFPGAAGGQSLSELAPKPLRMTPIRRARHIGVVLEVEPGAIAAHAVHRVAARPDRVYELLGAGLGIGKESEPTSPATPICIQ